MFSWSEFAVAEPSLAAGIRALLEQYGPGMGYLATVRADGAPRVHPVSPVFTDRGLFCFIVDSPKRRDLERDGRYALHSYPPEDSDDEAFISGRAERVLDPRVIADVATGVHASREVNWRLYELLVETATLRRHGSGGALPLAASPAVADQAQVWRAEARALATVG